MPGFVRKEIGGQDVIGIFPAFAILPTLVSEEKVHEDPRGDKPKRIPDPPFAIDPCVPQQVDIVRDMLDDLLQTSLVGLTRAFYELLAGFTFRVWHYSRHCFS